jgi:hypothetical protein
MAHCATSMFTPNPICRAAVLRLLARVAHSLSSAFERRSFRDISPVSMEEFFVGTEFCGDKKGVVPSDPIPSLALHRHARHRAPHRKVLSASPFRSPKADFSAPGSMPSGSPQSLFSMEPVSRIGLSLARNGCSFSEASIPGSMVPACYFKTSRLVSLPGPPSAPLPSLVCPSRRQLLRLRPVAVLLAGSLGCFLCLHSPPGLLPPSGSKRSTDSAALRLTFRIRPMASRSPPPFYF